MPVEFLVHLANNTLTAEEAEQLAQIAEEPQVIVIREPMSLPEHDVALNSADIGLFPYEVFPYRKRNSGVFAEAAAYGKPVVGEFLAGELIGLLEPSQYFSINLLRLFQLYLKMPAISGGLFSLRDSLVSHV